ncbi:MAG: transposase [Dehalococcoidia bacterium]
MARSRYRIFDNYYPYFLTATIVDWLPLFSDPLVVNIILDSFQFMQKNDRLTIYAYVIMENHLHLVASSANLTKEIGNFKSYTARQVIDYYKHDNQQVLLSLSMAKKPFKDDRDYQFWQEGSHPQQIQNREMMRQKIEYCHHNPVRKGYIDKSEDWHYSSARDYAGKTGPVEVNMEW